MKKSLFLNQMTGYRLFVILILLIVINACSTTEDDFQNLIVNKKEDTISYNLGGIARFDLIKKSLSFLNNGDPKTDILLYTDQVLLTIENLTASPIENLNYWVIGYTNEAKKNSDISFIFENSLTLLNVNNSIGEVKNATGGLGVEFSKKYFDIEMSGFDGAPSMPTAGIYHASIACFKNDTVEFGATTGLCQINYKGVLKLIPDNESVFSGIQGNVTGNGKFFGEINSNQEILSIVNTDSTLFFRNENIVTAVLNIDGFLPDSISRIDLDLTKY